MVSKIDRGNEVPTERDGNTRENKEEEEEGEEEKE